MLLNKAADLWEGKVPVPQIRGLLQLDGWVI